MNLLQEKINEITGFNCNENELYEIIDYVINSYFKTFNEVTEKDIKDRNFSVLKAPNITLSKELQDTEYSTDDGYIY